MEELEEQKREKEEAAKGVKKANAIPSLEEAQLKAAAEEINPADLRQIPMELAVYELTGPLFFGAADRINQITVGGRHKMPDPSYACSTGGGQHGDELHDSSL